MAVCNTAVPSVAIAVGCVYVLCRRGRMPTLEFLIVASALAAVLCSTSGGAHEFFNTSTDTASFVDKLASIPRQTRDVILPAFDKLIGVFKGEGVSGKTLNKRDYPDMDTNEKFAQLAQQYKQVDDLLLSMKNYDNATYQVLMRLVE